MAFEVTVAFPVIGAEVPPVALPPEEFLDRVAHDGVPHWLYHLRVRHNARGRFDSPLWGIGGRQLEELARKLRLAGGFTLHPAEFVPGEFARADCSPYAFGYPLIFAQGSAYLATAVGMAAAHARRPLPNWLLLSGSLAFPFRDDLRFHTTAGIEEKVLLALGARPEYQTRPLLDRLYQDDSTPRHLGPRRRRVQPGRVRLLLVPTGIDTHPLEFTAPLDVRAVDLPAGSFGQATFAALEAEVRRLAGDDLLLVQVPSPFHALRLLGFATPPGAADERPPHAFRVRQLPREGAESRRDEAGGSDVRQELEALEYRLARARAFDVYGRLTVILDRCRRLLRCESGDVAVVGPDPDWLRVMVRRGRAPGDLPHFVARHPAPDLDALGGAAPVVAPRAEDREEYRAARSEANPLYRRFGTRKFHNYQDYLSSIRSYVGMPLVAGGRAVGVMYLHRAREGPFHPAMLRLAEALAGRAAREVAALLDDEAAGDLPASFVAEFRRWVDDLGPAFGCVWVASGAGRWECAWSFGEEPAERARPHLEDGDVRPLLGESAWLGVPGREPDARLRPLCEGLRAGLRARLAGLYALCASARGQDGRPLALALVAVPPPAQGAELLRRAAILSSLCRVAFERPARPPSPAPSPSLGPP